MALFSVPMRLPLCVLAILVGALAVQATAAEKPAATDCTLTRYASISFDISPEGIVSLPITINGTTVQMALHTSGTLNAIDEALAGRLQLKRISLPPGLISVGVKKVSYYTIPNALQLGSAKFKSPDMLIIADPVDGLRTSGGELMEGTIGMQLFGNVDVEIDFPKRLLSIYSTDHCPGNVVYWANAYDSVPLERDTVGQMYFPMELNGVKLKTTLATGATQTVLASEAAKKLFSFDESTPDLVTEKSADGTTTGYYRAMELSTEGLSIMNARIGLTKTHDSCRLVTSRNNKKPAEFINCRGSYPLLLGMNVLSKLHIYIATKEKKLYFTAADKAENPRH